MDTIVLMLSTAFIGALIAISYWLWRKQSVHKGLGFTVHWASIGDFLAGIAISAIAMVGIFAVGWLIGEVHIAEIQLNLAAFISSISNDLFGAAFEEIVSRSLQQNGLYIGLGLIAALLMSKSLGGTFAERMDKALVWTKWPAILLIAALFGWVHISNPGASWVTAFGNALGGLMYGIAFFGGRNIWLPLGMHFGWNFVQGPVLGFPVSGNIRTSVIMQQGVGSDLWMGGAYGPEGGLVGMAFRFVIIALVFYYLYLRARRQGSASRLEYPIPVYDNAPGSSKPLFRRAAKSAA